jgi:hypothetical protein
MVSLTDIHAYLHFKACQDHEVISTSSFACFFHPTSADEESNYALPEVCEGGDLQTNLRELLSLFGERVRTPTLQFIEELFPYLVTLLQFFGVSRGWKMGRTEMCYELNKWLLVRLSYGGKRVKLFAQAPTFLDTLAPA